MISTITAEFQSPLSFLPLLEASLISDVCNIMRDSMCKIEHVRASQAQSNTHITLCSKTGME